MLIGYKKKFYDGFLNVSTGEIEDFDYSNPRWCFGGKGGSTSNTVTQTSNPPQYVADAYQALLKQANQVAATPFSQPTQPVAGFTNDQTNAMNTVAGQAGGTQPYTNMGVSAAQQGAQAIYPQLQQANPANINQYMSPYNQDVINATQKQLNQNDAIQQQQLLGSAIQSGASPFGGDRAGVAAATLANQQDLANNQTIANLNNQNYTQALNELNNQQQLQANTQSSDAWRQLSAAQLYPQIGTIAQNNALNQASAQLQSGALQQQLAQEQLNAPYNEQLAALAYPFQTTQFLGGLTEGIGSGSGGTSSTTSPGPSTTSQLAGLGLSGLAFNQSLPQGQGIGSLFGSLKRGGVANFSQGGANRRRPHFDFGGTVGIPVIPDVVVSVVPTASTQRSGNGPPSAPRADQQQGQSIGSSLSTGSQLGGLFGSLSGSNNGSSGGSGGSVPGFGSILGGLTGNSGTDASRTAASNYINSSASDQVASDVAAEGSSSAGSGIGDWFSSLFSSWKQGGAVPHMASGGGPLDFLGMGSGSGNGTAQQNVPHANKWISQGGDIIGTVLGSIFGGPAGGYIGGKAGADAGGTLGDLFGGKWKSLESDIKAGPVGEDPTFKMIIGDNNSAAGQGNQPQLGGNFSGTTPFNAYGNGMPFNLRSGGVAHYDNGGTIGQNLQMQSPQVQAMYSQYSNMPVEKLQQLAVMDPNNPMIQKALQMKRMGQSSAPTSQGVAGAVPQISAGMSRGGVGHYDNGGYVNDIGARTDVSFDDLLNALPKNVLGPNVNYSSNDSTPQPQRKPPVPKKKTYVGIGESEPDFKTGGIAKYATDGYVNADPATQVLQDIAEDTPTNKGVASVNASDLLPPDAQGISLPAKSTDIPIPMPSSTEKDSDLDNKPVVDHSSDTVKIHYPSEGKSVDTGIPSMKDNTAASSAWMPLLAAGLGMMAGKSPHALTNIGEGGLEGLKALEEQRSAALKENQAQTEAQKLADDLAIRRQEMQREAARDAATQAYQKGELGLKEALLEQGKYVPVKNPLTGEQSVFNQKTGKWITPPMAGGVPMIDPETGDIIPGGAPSITPNSVQNTKRNFGFNVSNVTPNVYNQLTKEDSKQRQTYMNNRPVAQNVNRILDSLEPNLDLVDTGGWLNRQYAAAAQNLNPKGQTATASANIEKDTNDLATELGKFQYMPGMRGSVLGLQTILASKPGMQQPPQTNKNIINQLRAKTNDYLLTNELAEQYREKSPLKVTDQNTYTIDDALKTIYPLETTDPKTGNVTFNKQNIANIRKAIPDAIANPQKYIDLATKGAAQTSAPTISIPDSAIQHLKANPALAPAFEQKYGVPASQYLGQ